MDRIVLNTPSSAPRHSITMCLVCFRLVLREPRWSRVSLDHVNLLCIQKLYETTPVLLAGACLSIGLTFYDSKNVCIDTIAPSLIETYVNLLVQSWTEPIGDPRKVLWAAIHVNLLSFAMIMAARDTFSEQKYCVKERLSLV